MKLNVKCHISQEKHLIITYQKNLKLNSCFIKILLILAIFFFCYTPRNLFRSKDFYVKFIKFKETVRREVIFIIIFSSNPTNIFKLLTQTFSPRER